MVLSERSMAGAKAEICPKRVRLAHELPQTRQSAAALRLVTGIEQPRIRPHPPRSHPAQTTSPDMPAPFWESPAFPHSCLRAARGLLLVPSGRCLDVFPHTSLRKAAVQVNGTSSGLQTTPLAWTLQHKVTSLRWLRLLVHLPPSTHKWVLCQV